MDPAMILVLVLSAGVVALLVWFEINSRRNQARKKQRSSPAQPDLGMVGKRAPNTADSEIAKTKAA